MSPLSGSLARQTRSGIPAMILLHFRHRYFKDLNPMTTYTNELKTGLKVRSIKRLRHHRARVHQAWQRPAFTRIKIRNLKTGRVVERTYKSSESLESADVNDLDMQYLYTDGETYHLCLPKHLNNTPFQKPSSAKPNSG